MHADSSRNIDSSAFVLMRLSGVLGWGERGLGECCKEQSVHILPYRIAIIIVQQLNKVLDIKRHIPFI